jgi:hypothetical protein
VTGQPAGADGLCAQCGSVLRANAPFCSSCGHAVTNRHLQVPTAASPTHRPPPTAVATSQIVGAGRGVRCCCCLLDLAAMLSPALPLATVGAILGVAEVVYVVVPIAFVAVWLWMQIWQGITGMSFGKAMLGLRLISASDRHAPGLAATVTRSGIFAGTLGLAALSVVTNPAACDGVHDRLSGLTMIDVSLGANPLGARQQTALRRSVDRGLNKVHSPVPLGTSGRP